MESFVIKNKEVIEILERFRYLYLDKYDIVNSNTNDVFSERFKGEADKYTGDKHLSDIIGLKEKHEGAASISYSSGLKPEHYKGDKPDEYRKDFIDVDARIKLELGLQCNALAQLYPPGGFIGWHNNANASAFNLIFTWSETGDGWFKYIDPSTNEMVTMSDQQGWTLKAGYFGQYGSGKVCYHGARTECTRMTISYVLGHNKDYWLDCIEHINND
tara:strand:- start:45408 stop:46055 length:648 start_codon:yes stop_codon:yes gene_type:complete